MIFDRYLVFVCTLEVAYIMRGGHRDTFGWYSCLAGGGGREGVIFCDLCLCLSRYLRMTEKQLPPQMIHSPPYNLAAGFLPPLAAGKIVPTDIRTELRDAILILQL